MYNKNQVISGRRCVIDSCRISRRINRNIKLFKFPYKNEQLLRVWLEVCELDYSLLEMKRLYICNKHFASEDMGKTRLKMNAIPRKYLKNNLEEESSRIRETNNERLSTIITKNQLSDKSKSGRNCIIKDCNIDHKNHNLKLLTFPKEASNLFNIWSDIFHINKGDIFNIKLWKLSDDNLYICEKHFVKYAPRPDIFTEIEISDDEQNSVIDEKEIDLNNIKLEFVSTDPLENNVEHNDHNKIQLKTNEIDLIKKTENIKKLLKEKEKFYQKKIKKMRKRSIKDRKIFYRYIRNLKYENKIQK